MDNKFTLLLLVWESHLFWTCSILMFFTLLQECLLFILLLVSIPDFCGCGMLFMNLTVDWALQSFTEGNQWRLIPHYNHFVFFLVLVDNEIVLLLLVWESHLFWTCSILMFSPYCKGVCLLFNLSLVGVLNFFGCGMLLMNLPVDLALQGFTEFCQLRLIPCYNHFVCCPVTVDNEFLLLLLVWKSHFV